MQHGSFEERFWAGVQKTDSCWIWIKKGGVGRSIRYGKLYMDGKETLAHRASWILHHGLIPAGMQVCHTCDNGLCVNPNHLFLGTQRDNMRDAAAKGRVRSPQQITGISPRLRLTERDLDAIVSSDAPSKELAAQYGVVEGHIRRIKREAGRPAKQGKFTADLIRQVRIAEGSGKDIAQRFGVSTSHVSRIRRGQARVRATTEEDTTDAAN